MNSGPDRSIEKLLKLAGERDMPSADATERARLAAQRAWLDFLKNGGTPSRSPWRIKVAWTLAAAASIGAASLLFFNRSDLQPVLVARVTAAQDGAVLRADRQKVLRAAANVYSGSTLETAAGRVALTVGDALSLRVDGKSRLRFDAADRVTLLEGSIYVDSGGLASVPALRIGTPAGEVRHIGTQFQVSVARDYTRVRVREGRVLLTPRDASAALDMAAGDELEIAGRQSSWRHGLPAYGADWEWVTSIGPAFAIENRPLAEFLAWLAREHGWQLHYSTDSLQQRTHEVRLHGSLDGLDTLGMIERVSLITGIPLRARDGELWVGAEERRP